jgi:hypothetical protein
MTFPWAKRASNNHVDELMKSAAGFSARTELPTKLSPEFVWETIHELSANKSWISGAKNKPDI